MIAIYGEICPASRNEVWIILYCYTRLLLNGGQIIADDGQVWTIKAGTNRFQTARDLGYDSIDGIMCANSDECAKLTMWFKECDPLRNPEKLYTGAWSYQ